MDWKQSGRKKRRSTAAIGGNTVKRHGFTASASRENANSFSEENMQQATASSRQLSLCQEKSFQGNTSVVALDCEMVGVGVKGHTSVLARISIVNFFGHVLLDEFVKPAQKVTDYRTFVSGIYPKDLKNAKSLAEVQQMVGKIVRGKIIVGHDLSHDFKCLYHRHPKKAVRDTSRYKPFRNLSGGRTPALKTLCSKLLNIEIQRGEHSSIVDAQAAMRLYALVRKDWEGRLQGGKGQNNLKGKMKNKRQNGVALSQDEIHEVDTIRQQLI